MFGGFFNERKFNKMVVLREEKDVKGLLKMLKSSDSEIKKVAIDYIGDLREKCALVPILQELENPDLDIRSTAVKALGKIKSKKATESLIKALKDKEDKVVSAAINALGVIKDPKSIEPLLDMLNQKRKFTKNVTSSLGGFNDKKVIKILLKLLNNDDAKVRDRAKKSLCKTKADSLKSFVIETLNAKSSQYDKLENGEISEILFALGDKSLSESEIDYLFKRPVDLNELETHEKYYKNLFNDYTRIILKASGYFERNIHDRDSMLYQEEWILQANKEALDNLCQIKSYISNNILHKIAKKKDIKLYRGESNITGLERYSTLNLDDIRKKAKIQLVKRGNPPYDPDAYLIGKYWKLGSGYVY